MKNIVDFLNEKSNLDEDAIKSQYVDFPAVMRVDNRFINALKSTGVEDKKCLLGYYNNEIQEANARLAQLTSINAESLSDKLSTLTEALQKHDGSIDAVAFFIRDMIISRSTCESYSNVFDTRGHLNPQGLLMLDVMNRISSNGNKIALANCGLAEDYCVGNTALDLAKLAKITGKEDRFQVVVISDATDHIIPEQQQAIHAKFDQAGVRLMTQEQYADAVRNKFKE